MAESLWTPDQHIHMRAFSKLLQQSWKHCRLISAWRWTCAQRKLHVDNSLTSFGPEELGCPALSTDLDTDEHLRYELDHRLYPRPSHLRSASDIIVNVFVTEWSQTPRCTLHNLVESLPRSVEIIIRVRRLKPEWGVQQAHWGVMVRCPQLLFMHITWL